MEQLVHYAFGVYGIMLIEQKLVVIKKTDGPYINRYDLPGGSLMMDEPLSQALCREIREETGLMVQASQQLGTTSFIYPWLYQKYTLNQHLAVFYKITDFNGELQHQVPQFDGQDAKGAQLIDLSDLSLANASPLVLKAKQFIETGQFDPTDVKLENWPVLKNSVY